MLSIFALVVLVVLIVAGCVLATILGGLPGKIARERNHPQAEAINVCGWFGLLTLGLFWPVATIWAYTRPGGLAPEHTDDPSELLRRVATLEGEVRRLAELKGGSA